MLIELPFELDTIDAIAEAETTKEKLVAIWTRVSPFFIHSLCAVLEYVSFILLQHKAEERIECFKYFEISDPANVFLVIDTYCILPDLMFAVLGPFSLFMIYNNPYTVFFNGSTGIINIVNGVLYNVFAWPCGNPEQGLIYLAPIFSYVCGILHLALAVLAHVSFMYLDKEGEIYFGRIEDAIDEVKGRG